MNAIISITDPSVLTMISRETSDLVESRHNSVKRTIKRLSKQDVMGNSPMVEYKDSLGRTAAEPKIICNAINWIRIAKINR